jgi:hypothetical protein
MNKSSLPAILLLVLFLLPAQVWAAKKKIPLASINFLVVRDENGKPIRNAAVVMHPVDEHGKQERGGIELKTSPEGKANFEGVPYGKLRVQVLAPGFQTYGEDYDIGQPNLDITVKMKRPRDQYSIYQNQPAETKDQAEPRSPEKPPQNQ